MVDILANDPDFEYTEDGEDIDNIYEQEKDRRLMEEYENDQ